MTDRYAPYLEPATRLSRDMRKAAATLSDDEARFLIRAYYQQQDSRIRAANQLRALAGDGEPHEVLEWKRAQDELLEKQVAGALKRYVDAQPLGRWATSIIGIGPILAASLLAHIDISKAPTAGHIWRYAGLDPTVRWEKGQRRPWNAELKRVVWLIGESFVKVQSHEDDVYGKVYAARKELETARNEAGEYADQAALALKQKKWRDGTDARAAYEKGMLPKARIHARAKRYAAKLFLSHYQEVGWWLEYGEAPPVPYAMAHAGHAHKIEPPNFTPPGTIWGR